MPTTVVKTIGSGGDYTSLQAWEDACPSNLVSSDQIWQGQIKASTDAFSSASTLLTVAGTTVDSTHYVELTTAAGASFRDNASVQTNALRWNTANGCTISLTGDYTTAIVCNQGYTRFSKLQVQSTQAHSATISCQPDTAGVNDWNGCILESNIQVGTVYGNVNIRNSLLVSRSASLARIVICGGSNAAFYNCTLAVPSNFAKASACFTGSYVASQLFQNCAFFGVTDVGTTTNRTFTTCGTDDATPPTGCTTYTYNTSLFQNITDSTRDYRIPSGSSLIGAGTTDTTNAAVDIAGTTRTGAWDIGCWQYVSAAAGQVKKIDGLAIASVKNILGTAKSSLKKWDGLTL